MAADRDLRPLAPKISGELEEKESCLNSADASLQELVEQSDSVETYLDLEDAVNLGRLKERLEAQARRG